VSKSSSLKLGRRPVFIAAYGEPKKAEAGAEIIQLPIKKPVVPAVHQGIRYNFPAAGESREGGLSDGYCYRITFAAGRLERTYDLVVAFLNEQGYGNLPLPANAEELRRFKLPPKFRRQLSLFGDNGYCHNPIRILFPVPAGHKGALKLELCNEAHERHLLRFHRREMS